MTAQGPNFLVIGAARSGTTALTHLVSGHPEGFVTEPKEPHFFAFAGARPDFVGPGDEEGINRRAVIDLGAYVAMYEGSGGALARGEGSVSTLYYHQRSIRKIQRWFPEVRLVAILRDPVERAFSAHQYLRTLGHEPEADFERALDLEPDRVRSNWHHLWHYARMGFYARQLGPFLEAFGRERVKVLFHEDLEERPADVARELFTFLGIDPDVEGSGQPRVNASGQARRPALYRAMRTAARVPLIRRTAERVLPRGTKERIRSASLRRVEMPTEARDRLRELYREDVRELRVLLRSGGPSWLVGDGAEVAAVRGNPLVTVDPAGPEE